MTPDLTICNAISNGREVGRGGHSWAEFWVADPIPADATVTIRGAVEGADWWPSVTSDPETVSDARVAFVYETWNPGTLRQKRTVLASMPLNPTAGEFDAKQLTFAEDYTLAVPVTDLLAVPQGAWVGVVVFGDEDGNGTWNDIEDQWGGYYSEYAWWPDNGFSFDIWGGVLRLMRDYCTPAGMCYSGRGDRPRLGHHRQRGFPSRRLAGRRLGAVGRRRRRPHQR